MAETKKRRTDDEILEEVAGQSLLRSYMQNPAGISMPVQGASADLDSPFREGIAAGTAQVKGDFKQFGALLSLMKGDEEAAKRKLASADFLYEQADEISQNFVQFEDAFDDFGNLGEYSKLQIGKLVPQILSSVGTGLGSAVVYGLGKGLVKAGSKQYLKKKATSLLNKEKAGIPLTKAEQKFLQEGYGGHAYLKKLKDNKVAWRKYALDKDAAALTGKVFGTKIVGGAGLNAQTAFWAGSFGQSEVIGAAQSAQEYRDQGIELTSDEAAMALLYGVPQALLDTASEFVFFRGALKVAVGDIAKATTTEGKKQAAGVVTDILKASAIQAGKSAILEGVTETSQEGVLIGQRLYDPLSGGKYADPTYDKEMIRMRLLESGFVGALAGGARGAGGGVIAKSYDLLADKEDTRAGVKEAQERIRKQGSPATETMRDVTAQIKEMFNPDRPRNVVFMANFTPEDLEALGSTERTLGFATLDMASLMAEYPGLRVLPKSDGQNPGLFLYDDNNTLSKDIADAIVNGQEITNTYLKEILGYEAEQNPEDPWVLVTKNKDGDIVKSQSIPADEDGSTTTLDKAIARAEQDYPESERYTTEAMEREDFLTELQRRMEDESPEAVQQEFDFVDVEEDPDIQKAEQEEANLDVKDVKSPGPMKEYQRQALEEYDKKTQEENAKLKGAAATVAAKVAAVKILKSEHRFVVRDPDTKSPKSTPFKNKEKIYAVIDATGTVRLKTVFKGENALEKAHAIQEALEVTARLEVLAPDMIERADGSYEITFKVKGFTPFAAKAEMEGPRYNRNRIAEQSDERLSESATDTSLLPSVASLEGFEDTKSFLYSRNLQNLEQRALNSTGRPVTRRAKRSWERGNQTFQQSGFFTPLSAMTEAQQKKFTPSRELREKLQALLVQDVENKTSIPNSQLLSSILKKFQFDEETGAFKPDIPSVVYEAIIDANLNNPDAELLVIRTNRKGEPISSDFKYEARESKTDKTELVKVPDTQEYFYRLVEVVENENITALRESLKTSFQSAHYMQRPRKNMNDLSTAFGNRWNTDPYAEAFRITLDPLQDDPEIIKRNKGLMTGRYAGTGSRPVSMTQLLSGEALRRKTDTSMGTTGIIGQDEYTSIINFDNYQLVLDNFFSLLQSLKQMGLVLEYGPRYKVDSVGNFIVNNAEGKYDPLSQRLAEGEGYAPVIELDNDTLKSIVIPRFKSRESEGKPPIIDNYWNSSGRADSKTIEWITQQADRQNKVPVRSGKKIPQFLEPAIEDFTSFARLAQKEGLPPNVAPPIPESSALLQLEGVISGGQTGADIIFSQAAKEAGLQIGGTAAKGFKTEAGNKPEYAKEFNMIQDTVTGYVSRTKKNVANSDGTIVVVNDPKNLTSGSKRTVEFAKELNKPVLVVKPTVNASTIRDFIDKNEIKVLNGAGSRGSTLKNQAKLKNTLAAVFKEVSFESFKEATSKIFPSSLLGLNTNVMEKRALFYLQQPSVKIIKEGRDSIIEQTVNLEETQKGLESLESIAKEYVDTIQGFEKEMLSSLREEGDLKGWPDLASELESGSYRSEIFFGDNIRLDINEFLEALQMPLPEENPNQLKFGFAQEQPTPQPTPFRVIEKPIKELLKSKKISATYYETFMGANYVGKGRYQGFIDDLKEQGKTKEEIDAINLEIREVHVAKTQFSYPGLGITGILENGSTLSLTPEGQEFLKRLEPTATRLMVGNHGIYIEMDEPVDTGTFVAKRKQYNEYRKEPDLSQIDALIAEDKTGVRKGNLRKVLSAKEIGIKLYDQFETVNYADYEVGKWYADPKQYPEVIITATPKIPNPNKKEQRYLSSAMTKLNKFKRLYEDMLTAVDESEIIDTIYELGLENSDVSGFKVETTLEKIAEEKNNKTIKDKDKTKLTTTQKEVLDKSVIRGILGLTSKEDTHANYPFKDVGGGLDFINALEEKLNKDFELLSKDVRFTESLQEDYDKAKTSVFVTEGNPLFAFNTSKYWTADMFPLREKENLSSYLYKIPPGEQVIPSDFELILEGALDTLELVDQTIEAKSEYGVQSPVVDVNLQETRQPLLAGSSGTEIITETDMFAMSRMALDERKLTGERSVVITDQARYGTDEKELSGPRRVEASALTWKEYKPLTSGKTTFGPEIKNFFSERILIKPETLKGPEQTINVWAGTDENTILSNLAVRPFTAKDGTKYKSVEHAYQTRKSGTFDQDVYDKYKKASAVKGQTPKIQGKKRARTTDGYNITLMERIIRASFAQNVRARQALINTGNATITHTQDKGIWATEFPRILTELRTELIAKAEPKQSPLGKGGEVFTDLEALDQTIRNRFKNTRDITVLSVDDMLSTIPALSDTQKSIIGKIRVNMIKNKEPAKYIGYSDTKDLILLNPYAYEPEKGYGGMGIFGITRDDVNLRKAGLYSELAHELGHSIIEDQIEDLFKFGNKELRKDFMDAFNRAKAKLEAKGDMKYSDPVTGPKEFVSDQIAALALADISLKEDNPIRKQLGLQNAEGVKKYSFDNLLTKRLRAFLRRILSKLKTYLDIVNTKYNNRFKVARTARGDVDTRFLTSLNKTLSTFRTSGRNQQILYGNTFTQKMVIMDAATTVFEDQKKRLNKKQAKKLASYLARQVSALYNSELGLTRVFGHPAEHWSMKYMFSPAASYLTKVSVELGKSFYGLTQSEDDFGYKRTYLIIQNQKMSDLIANLPTDEKGRPDYEALQVSASLAENYVDYSDDDLKNSKSPAKKVAYNLRVWLNDFFNDYIQDPNNPVPIKELQNFFPRLWNMVELRRDARAREVLTELLFEANKNKRTTIKEKGKEISIPTKVYFEDRENKGKTIGMPVNKIGTWEKFVDAWLGTDEDNDSTVQEKTSEDSEFNIDQNRKRPQDTQNLSIGMAKSRDSYFLALETGNVRKAEAKHGVTLLSSPENALRRYVQDTVKKIEYAKNVQTAFTIEDYERMVELYGEENVPFEKPKKRNIAPKGEYPVFIQEYRVYGAKAAEVMISRIEDPAKRQGARKGVEALLGKAGAGMSPFMRQVNSWGLLVNWFGYLTFAVLASAPDMAGPLLRGKGLIGVSDIVKEAIVPWTKDAEFAKQFALDIGVVTHESITNMFIDAAELGFMNETTQKYAGFYFKAIGLDWYTNFTRTYAAGLGEQFIFRLGTSKQNRSTTRWLAELGLTAEDVIYWHNQNGDKGRGRRDFSTPQGEKVRMAIAQFVEESILRPGAAERPIWASNPYFALIFQLKSFFYAYGKTVIGGVYREALNKYADGIADGKKPSSAMFGATAPIAIGASALLVMTAIGLELRELIKYLINGGDSTKFRSNNMDWGEYIFEMIDRAGILGPFGIAIPIMEAPRYGDSMILEAFGPTAGRIDDLLVQGNIATNPEDSFWSFVPIASGMELDWF